MLDGTIRGEGCVMGAAEILMAGREALCVDGLRESVDVVVDGSPEAVASAAAARFGM